MLQHFAGELQVALDAALDAVVRVDIPRAEATLRARQTDCFALEVFRVLQDFHVEHVYLQHVVASVAALTRSFVLALYAFFRILFEGARNLRCTAGDALVACSASEGRMTCSLRGVVPLRIWERFPGQELATDRAFLDRTALIALRRSLWKLLRALAPLAAGTGVAPGASQEPIKGVLHR